MNRQCVDLASKDFEVFLSGRKTLLNIVIVSAGLWAVSYWPSLMLNGRLGVVWMTVAVLLCGLPAFVNRVAARSFVTRDALVGVWVHMAVRVGFVFFGVVVVRAGWPLVGISQFYGWLMGFYLITMACDVLEYQRVLRSGSNS